MGRACSTNGERMNVYRILVRKSEGKIQLGRTRRRWLDNIKMEHREIGLGGVEWIGPAQDRDQWRAFVNTVTDHKMLESSCIAAQLAASQEGLSSMKLARRAWASRPLRYTSSPSHMALSS
jgi:hypothetical protein